MSARLSKAVKGLITCFVYSKFSLRIQLLILIGNDVVASLSIGLIRDFRNVTYNLWREPGMAESVIGKVLGVFPGKSASPVRDESEELWCWALLKTLRADMDAEKLYPPGRIFWINARTEYMSVTESSASQPPLSFTTAPGETMTMHLVEDVEFAFSEFTFSSTMFTDHAPNNYEYALQMLYSAMEH